MSFEAGTRLGRYEIRSLLGAGGMGEVYRAKDPKLERDVAIKVLSSDFSKNPDRLRRFEQEARAAGALNHPAILSIYDVATHDDVLFVVSELLEGETLRMRLRNQNLSPRKAIEYALQIARGLGAAHEKGIVHRDLKPENLFITKEGRIKILDFGLAKLLAPQNESEQQSSLPTQSSLTAPGTVIGTVAYMSPEQVRGQHIDHRTDIFSFGTVLYEMITGKLPFVGDSAVEIMNAILKEDPLTAHPSGLPIPPALERILRRCLEKNPGERFQSASDLAFALETISGLSDSQTTIPIASTSSSRKQLGWIAADIVLVGTVITAAMLIPRLRQEEANKQSIRFPLALPEKVKIRVDVETHNMAISPDGTKLAFVATSHAKRMLWLRPLDALTAAPLNGTEGVVSPFWSPDSRYIAFFAEGKLKKIDSKGGTPQTICDLASDAEDRIGAWAADGTILFSEEGNRGGIYRTTSAGEAPSLVIEGGKEPVYWVEFLPDSKHFLLWKPGGSTDKEQTPGIYLAELGSSETRLLLPAKSRVEYTVSGRAAQGYLFYVRDGALVAHPFDAKKFKLSDEPMIVVDRIPYFDKTGWSEFSVSRNGVLAYLNNVFETELGWYDRNGREMDLVGPPNAKYGPRISPDGEQVAMSIVDPNSGSSDIWIHNLKRGTRTRFAFGPTDDADSVWSPDATQMAFFSCCENDATLYIKKVNDAGKGRQPLEAGFQVPEDWSLDGKFLLFTQGQPTAQQDLWVLPLTENARPYPFLQTQFNEEDGRFSPDGKWVAYVSNESGQDDVYVARFDRPQERWRISTTSGSRPRWRRDGKELFYVSPDHKLISVPVAPGDSFEPGVPSTLFRLDTMLESDYDVTSDGQRFLINRALATAQSLPFSVLINWPAAAKR